MRNTHWRRLYLNGEGVEKNIGLAVNWLAMAAKKQHVAAQATLGEMLWRGNDVRQREARGLALITLAHENAKASGKEPKWIGDLYREAFATSDAATRKEARALLPELGRHAIAATTRLAAKPANSIVLPAVGAARQSRSPPLRPPHSRPLPFRSARRARRRRRRSGSRSDSAPRARRPRAQALGETSKLMSSMKIGTWSDGFSQPRGRGIDLAGLTSRSAACGDSSRWSMRKPWFFCQAPA